MKKLSSKKIAVVVQATPENIKNPNVVEWEGELVEIIDDVKNYCYEVLQILEKGNPLFKIITIPLGTD